MKFALALIAAPLVLAFSVKRQELAAPDCALACFGNVQGSKCGMDIKCNCEDKEGQRASTQCLVDNCSSEDFAKAVGFAQTLCASVGLTISTDQIPEGVTFPAGFTPPGGATAPPAEEGTAAAATTEAVAETPAPSASAANPAPTGTAAPATSPTGTAAAGSSTSTAPRSSTTAPSSSAPAANATSTGAAMPTGVVNGFVAAAGVGAVVLGLL